MSGGVKFDRDKPRFDLLPPELLYGVSDILAFGAAKYGDRNWELGMNWSRVFGALMRHMWAWWRGENADAETGKSHLWHAGCCIAFLIAYEERKIGTDDRPSRADIRNDLGESIKEEPPDDAPKAIEHWNCPDCGYHSGDGHGPYCQRRHPG